MRPSDTELAEAYAETPSIYVLGPRYGVRPQTVHKWMQKAGIRSTMPFFTDAERDRIRADYAVYRAHGRVSELAVEMGRTVSALSRLAGTLGLADARHTKLWAGKWKHLSQDAARIIFDDFKASPLLVGQYCEKHGYDREGFRNTLYRLWPDEWEHVVEAKTPATSMYRLGRAVEYRFRDRLRDEGYFVLRSPASKSPVDLVAIKPGQVLFIQCKRSGALAPKAWNELYDLAISAGAVPIMAENPYPKCWRYWQLVGRKDGSKRRQPMLPFILDEAAS